MTIFCIVFICGIETCSWYDVTELIRPSLFSPGHDFKSSTLNPNISGSIYLFEEWYISFESSRHGEFLKKNGDYDMCTLNDMCIIA